MKLLKDILYRTRIEQVVGSTNAAIERITFDSRAVVPFTAFVAVKGTRSDGHDFIPQAITQGATAIICEQLPEVLKEEVTYVRVNDAQQALAIMAANFHDQPSRALTLVGITGTNGKTSTATLLYRLYRALGFKCGLISTVEIRIGQRTISSTHTTPDAIRLNELLAEMVAEKVTHCFMEVSSHSVMQERITGLEFDATGLVTGLEASILPDYFFTVLNSFSNEPLQIFLHWEIKYFCFYAILFHICAYHMSVFCQYFIKCLVSSYKIIQSFEIRCIPLVKNIAALDGSEFLQQCNCDINPIAWNTLEIYFFDYFFCFFKIKITIYL